MNRIVNKLIALYHIDNIGNVTFFDYYINILSW